MWKTSLLLISFVLRSSSGVPVGNKECDAGFALWASDGQCYRLYTQGPCLEDEVLVTSLIGPSCAKFEDEDKETEVETLKEVTEVIPKSSGWSLGSLLYSNASNSGDRWDLPVSDRAPLSGAELSCLGREQVFWPGDGQCYSLLSQGPCGDQEWLVVARSGDSVGVVCRHRPCPCDPAAPDLCEVELEEGGCECRVALAAAQDGLCEVGEQLLVNPMGFGECGCITSPPHTTWPGDGRCYPVHSQGPCEPGFTLTISDSSLEPSCQPALCQEGRVEYDGECHYLGSQGPCQELEILTLDSDTLEPTCVLNTSQVKRVYDIIPRNKGVIKNGPLLNTFKVRDCKRDSNGKCRRKFFIKKKSQNNLYVKQRSPRKYLNWLKSFRQTKRRNGY